MSLLTMPVRSDLKSYEFTTDLDGSTFTFRVRYNDRTGLWSMDIADAQNNSIINGIQLQTEVPLIDHIKSELKPLGDFILIDETGESKDPSAETLGEEIQMIYREAN